MDVGKKLILVHERLALALLDSGEKLFHFMGRRKVNSMPRTVDSEARLRTSGRTRCPEGFPISGPAARCALPRIPA